MLGCWVLEKQMEASLCAEMGGAWMPPPCAAHGEVLEGRKG